MFIWNPYYSLFFVGILFADLRASGRLDTLRQSWLVRCVGPGLVFLCWLLDYELRKTPPVVDPHSAWQHVRLWVQNHEMYLEGLLLVAGVYLSRDLVRLFRGPVARFVGRISFPVYLWQFLVIGTVESELIIHFSRHLRNGTTCALIAIAAFGVTVVVAYGVSFVENALLRGLDRVVSALLSGPVADRADGRQDG